MILDPDETGMSIKENEAYRLSRTFGGIIRLIIEVPALSEKKISEGSGGQSK